MASGNVVFTSEYGCIAADRVEFDIDLVTGTFYGASLNDVARCMDP